MNAQLAAEAQRAGTLGVTPHKAASSIGGNPVDRRDAANARGDDGGAAG
jgi:hypothetical protein